MKFLKFHFDLLWIKGYFLYMAYIMAFYTGCPAKHSFVWPVNIKLAIWKLQSIHWWNIEQFLNGPFKSVIYQQRINNHHDLLENRKIENRLWSRFFGTKRTPPPLQSPSVMPHLFRAEKQLPGGRWGRGVILNYLFFLHSVLFLT